VSHESNSQAELAAMLNRLGAATAAPDAAAICAGVKNVLMQELSQVAVPAAFLQPVTTGYARRCLYKDPKGRFSVVVMVWAPGQGTPLHDHAGHWCVECVYGGKIRVRSFEREAEDSGRICFRECQSVVSGIGAAGALIPPHEYHSIDNPFDTPAVTIHVYEGEITWCNAFEPLAEAGWFQPERHELAYTV